MKTIARAKITSTDMHYLHHIHAGRYDLQTDEPVALGGQGQGPAPFDLYLASLSACTAITLRMYAEKKGWALGEFRIELKLPFGEDGRLDVLRELHSDQPLGDATWQRLLAVSMKTPVTKAMLNGADIRSVRGGAAA